MTPIGIFITLAISVTVIYADGNEMIDEMSNVLIGEMIKEGKKLTSNNSEGASLLFKEAAFKQALPKLQALMAKYKVNDPESLAIKIAATVENNPQVRALSQSKEGDDALSPRMLGGSEMLKNILMSFLNLSG